VGALRNDDRRLGRLIVSRFRKRSPPNASAAFFPVKRSAEAIRLGARFDEVHLIGQAIKHHLAWPRVREHRVPLREGEIRGLARPGFSKKKTGSLRCK
jgi:hypothetical protein